MCRVFACFLLLTFVIPSYQQLAIPGARASSLSWSDERGVFWLFGGSLATGAYLNDLWSYKPSTNQWSFISGNSTASQPGIYGELGVPSSSNIPGSRDSSVSWIDSNGKLWLFGGTGFGAKDFGHLNDLWNYNPSTNQWTWVSGSTETSQIPSVYGEQGIPSNSTGPGLRSSSVSWIDLNGTFWLFGGVGFGESLTTFSPLNDLWNYNPSTTQWTWMHGSKQGNQQGVLGIQGAPSSSNFPGARYGAVSWTDSTGRLWLFGGTGVGNGGGTRYGSLNDLWNYNPSTNEWTWMSGNDTLDQVGVFGAQGGPSISNVPCGRSSSVSWTDSNEKLWLFGGSTSSGWVNDLWNYNPTTNQWTWIGGSNLREQPGVYGTQGVPSPSNVPGARAGSVSWIDSNDTLWLFGGIGLFNVSGQPYVYGGSLNDMWSFNLSTNQWTWMSGIDPATLIPVVIPVDPPLAVPSASIPLSSEVHPQSISAPQEEIIGIAVSIPVVVVGVGAIILAVLLGLRKRKANKQKNQQVDNPISLIPRSDKRLIPSKFVTLEKEIGAGSYGKVYVGKWRSTKVAVKVGNAAISTEQFVTEAELQMNIPPHPNIVQLLGVSTDGPRPLVVLEYCNEGSLDKLLFDRDEILSTEKQLVIIHSIAKGLDHLHENSIVHRDLAARNILIHNGEAKISDFGLSRALKEESQVGKTASAMGPIRWMAPESIASQSYGTKSDVWMFGIILYEITARQEPHIGEDQLNIAIKIRDSGLTPTIPEDCLPILREIMQMCWQLNPNMRPTMAEICHKLDEQPM